MKPSKTSIDRVTRKISDIIKKAKAWKQEDLINVLNPIITGWSNYHQSVVSKAIFSKMDSLVWNMLWKWAKRRHLEKSRTWIANKYWHFRGTRRWVFSTEDKQLKFFQKTKIVRHLGLTLAKNPYLDKEYFDQRRRRMNILKLADRYETTEAKCDCFGV